MVSIDNTKIDDNKTPSLKPLILITGASSGIELELAKSFSKAGYRTGLIARNLEAMEKLDIPNSICRSADVTNYNALKNVIDEMEEKFGAIDCLINNAGISKFAEFEDIEHDTHENIVSVNLSGVINCLEVVLPKLQKQKTGSIINISSVADRNPRPQLAVYAATKAAVKSLSESLRISNAKYGIRICNVAPALVDTPILNHIVPKVEHTIPVEEFAKTILWIYEQPQNICIRDIVIAPTQYQ
jgi:NADP-dependent 3-hydroxy acid dehydrogenase YdfG